MLNFVKFFVYKRELTDPQTELLMWYTGTAPLKSLFDDAYCHRIHLNTFVGTKFVPFKTIKNYDFIEQFLRPSMRPFQIVESHR